MESSAEHPFSYVPDSGSKKTPYFILFGPGFLLLAVIQGIVQEKIEPAIGLIVLFILCGPVLLILAGILLLQKMMMKNNIIAVTHDGVLKGSFGGIKTNFPLKEYVSINAVKDRTTTKIFGKKEDGKDRLLMAFYGTWDDAQQLTFKNAVKKTGPTCTVYDT